MNGEAYVEAFGDFVLEEQNSLQSIGTIHEGVEGLYGLLLSRKIVSILGSGALNGNVEERAYLVAEADFSLTVEKAVHLAGQKANNDTRQGHAHQPDSIRITRIVDYSEDADPSEIVKALEKEIVGDSTELVRFSDLVISKIINSCYDPNKPSKKPIPLTPERIHEAIRQTFMAMRFNLRPLTKKMGPHTVTDLSEANSHRGVGEYIGLNVSVENHSAITHVPHWITATEHWQDGINSLSAHYIEVDAFIALWEWVLKNHLPYVPVFAPVSFEQGTQRDKSEGSLHTDLMLLPMMPDYNTVVPIQAKNRLTNAVRSRYSWEMVFVEARDLVAPTARFIPSGLNPGTSSPSFVYELSQPYGRITQGFADINFHPKGRAPSKKEKQHHAEMLAHPFAFFDAKVRPKLQLEAA